MSEKILCQHFFCVSKNFVSKIILDKKEFWVQKNVSVKIGPVVAEILLNGQMLPGHMLTEQMSPCQLASVKDCPMNLP